MRVSVPHRVFRPAIGLAVVTAFSAAGIPLTSMAASSSPPSVVRYPVTNTGIAAQVTARSNSAHSASPSTRERGVRTMPAAHRAATGGRTTVPVTADAAGQGGDGTQPGDSRSGGALLRHFNGVSSLDSELTNFGARFEPPDQGLCEGNGFVLEAVNSAYSIYRRDGAPIAGPFNVNDLFQRDGLAYTTDPRCYFDPTTRTWIATIAFIADDNSSSTIDIAVNPSGDPTTAWTVYRLDTTDAGGPGCPCFGDQPRFGIDDFNLYLSSDEFSILGPEFNGGQLYAVSKRDLVRRRPALHFAHFGNLTMAGIVPGAIEPAITNGPAPAEYFLNSLDPDGTFDNRIGVWAMTNREDLADGQVPTLLSVVIGSETYGVPPRAVQKGASATLDSGDDRMQQAQFINGTLWGELGTALSIAGDPTVRAGAAWFNVRPSLDEEEVLSARMIRQGYVASRGNYLLYPALQADQLGNAAMVVTISGATRYPSAAFAVMRSNQSGFGPVTVAAVGSGPYHPRPNKPGRWGDYSWAQLDPATDTVWLATEYVPPRSSQTKDRMRNWGTEVLEVKLG